MRLICSIFLSRHGTKIICPGLSIVTFAFRFGKTITIYYERAKVEKISANSFSTFCVRTIK